MFNNIFKRGPDIGLLAQMSEKSGWLTKKGGVVKSWHRRWFTIKGDYMYYFSNDDESKQPLGHIFLPGNKVLEHPLSNTEPDKFLFEVLPGNGGRMTTTHESYLICAASSDERRDWIRAIRRVMHGDCGGAIFGQVLETTLNYERRREPTRKVPEIVQMCVEFLQEHGMEMEGIFRLPGRSSLVREFREKFDCGERPTFTETEADVHTIASLLKSYLRELPTPLIPFLYYEAVMQVGTREMALNPDEAIVKFEEILKEIPQANYNVLQYLCRFLYNVSALNDVNKMTAMNLATVFAQSFIYPEEDEPALMMGTASNRTQVVFVMIQCCESLFKAEYTARGAAVLVDTLLDIGAGGGEGGGEGGPLPDQGAEDHFGAVALRESTSMDLMGLDWSGDAGNTTSTTTTTDPLTPVSGGGDETPQVPIRPARRAPKIPPRPASPPKTNSTSSNGGGGTERLYPSLPRDVDPDPASWSDSSPVTRRADTSSLRRNDASSADRPAVTSSLRRSRAPSVEGAEVAEEGGWTARKGSVKRDRRGWVVGEHISVDNSEEDGEEGEVQGQGEVTPAQPATPQIPPRPKQRSPNSVSSVTSDSVNGNYGNAGNHGNARDVDAEEEARVDALLAADLSDLSRDDVISHVTELRAVIGRQRVENAELRSDLRALEGKMRAQTQDWSRRLDQEKTATAEAVDRVMLLSHKLQEFSMQYGDLQQ